MQEDQPRTLSPAALDAGRGQLEYEIRVLKRWLKNLEKGDDDEPDSLALRKTYNDMLYSRKQLLHVLKNS